MRVAIITPEFLPTWGGVGTYSVELVRNLCRYDDLEIHVITPARGKGYDKEKIQEYFGNRIHIHNISQANDTFFYNLAFQLAVLRNFRRLDKELKFDLVHSTSLVHMPDLYLKFSSIGIPCLTTIHSTLKSQSHVNGVSLAQSPDGQSAVEKLTLLAYPYIGLMEKIYLQRTSNLIAVSGWIKGFVSDAKGSKNIEVIRNGVDTSKFSPAGKEGKDDFSYLKEQGKPIILYCGRLLAMKGLKTLIDSMQAVLAKEDAIFVFAGSGDIKAWERILQKAGIPPSSYRFLGYVPYETIHLLYRKADIFVLPSFTDSCPLTVLEAMSSGLPVIASDVGGISELVADRKDGLLVHPGDPRLLGSKLVQLLKNKGLRDKLSRNAREKVLERFDSRIMAGETRRYYDKLMVNAR